MPLLALKRFPIFRKVKTSAARYMAGLAAIVWAICASGVVTAEETADLTPMTVERLSELVSAIDAKAETPRENYWVATVADLTVQIIADPIHDRMRVMSPIARVEDVPPEVLLRAMQANFDTALDARYAIARGVVWATYIHPLSPLQDDQFLSGIGQTANLVRTFGGTFYSGALTFGGGDSQGLLERDLIEELLRKGEAI